MDLNEIMEMDHVITVRDDGTVTDGPSDLYAPELLDGRLDSGRWEMLDGYSGQYGYSGPVMHPSEYIGGALERDILAMPGIYVVVAAYCSSDECRFCGRAIEWSTDEGWIDPQATADDEIWRTTCDENHDDREAEHEPDDAEPEGWAVCRYVGEEASK